MLDLNVLTSLTSSSSRRIYDVFLSFRGEDTRYKFVGHLYAAMQQRGIVPIFKDDEKLQRGETISPTLLKAIEESKVYVVVLSENYANSRWCLDELVKILECKKELEGRIVYPIFYEVNPSEVRNQIGRFGQGFEKLLCSRNYDAEKVQKWKEALKEVANFSGSEYPRATHLYESKFIQGIVSKVFPLLNHELAIYCNEYVGIRFHVEEVIKLLQIGSFDVRVIGIWGMGGIGKTTIASIVYNRLSHHFEGSCYLENVRENSGNIGGVRALQEQLISDVSKEKNLRVQNVSGGSSMIMRVTCNRRILIVLDDVDQLIQIEKLIGMKHHLGLGSRVVITTRDRHVLIAYDADDIYMVERLSDNESMQLFILKSFGKGQLKKGFEGLVRRAVDYAGGVPLALNVLGSFLKGRSKEEWVSALNRLKEWPEENIMGVLRLSYEGLGEPEQEIFLEVACSLRGWNKHRMTRILDSYGLHAEIVIGVLVDKSLICVSDSVLNMHDLIVELGQDIVRHESKEAGNRSRLWDLKDIKHVLTKNMGTEALKSIKTWGRIGEVGPKAFANMTKLRFLSIQGGVELSGGLEYLSNEMRYLKWYQYPLTRLPEEFNPKHLIELHMSESSLERFWEGEVCLENLKIMDLSGSKDLVETPNFTGITNLEELRFPHCGRLKEIHPSIGVLKKLVTLDFACCINLRSFPTGTEFVSLQFLRFMDCKKLMNIPDMFENMKCLSFLWLCGTGIRELPKSIALLTSLRELNLQDCQNLSCLPESMGNLLQLSSLALVGTGIRELPKSIENLTNLMELSFSGTAVGQLVNFKRFTSLSNLVLMECNLENVPSSLCSLSSLGFLDLSGNNFKSLPANMNQLSRLHMLALCGCNMLEELPELTPGIQCVDARDCKSLRTICNPRIYKSYYEFLFTDSSNLVENLEENILLPLVKEQFENYYDGQKPRGFEQQMRGFDISFPVVLIPEWFNHGRENGCSGSSPVSQNCNQEENCYGARIPRIFDITFPGEEIPEWFSHGRENGCSGSSPVPSKSNQEEVVGVALCLVFDQDHPVNCIHYSDFCVGSDFRCVLLGDGGFVERHVFSTSTGFSFRKFKNKTILIHGFFFKPRLLTTFGENFQYFVEFYKGDKSIQCHRIKQIGIRLIFSSGKEGDSGGNGMNDNNVTSHPQKKSSSDVNNKEEDIPNEKRSRTH